MFDNLTNRLTKIMRNISRRGRLTEENIKETLHATRIALLEADVALPVVQEFINQVKKHAIGYVINKSLTPGQEFIKIVRNELIEAMGSENHTLNLATQPPAVILIVGLQGAGKTTSIGKLGKLLREKYRKKVLVVSADIYRPAAIKQLETLAQQVGVDFYPSELSQKPVDIVHNSFKNARLKFYDVLLVDTTGHAFIDKTMIDEIKQIHTEINPVETLFVVDAMIGQDAASITKNFNAVIPLTGVILTKVDGDARGGAALSIRYITGKPIKFIGVGEKSEALEPFYPDRLVSRILGMSDIFSLIEEIDSKIDSTKVKKLADELKKGNSFNLNDFLEQIKQMPDISKLAGSLPGVSQLSNNIKLQTKIFVRMEAMINSMTRRERENPCIINGSRKRRIAFGAGVTVQDVNRMLKQFSDMQRMIKKIKKKGGIEKMLRIINGILPSGLPKC